MLPKLRERECFGSWASFISPSPSTTLMPVAALASALSNYEFQDLLYIPSLHSITYPRPFQKLPMQLKYRQKSPSGLVISPPPQKL